MILSPGEDDLSIQVKMLSEIDLGDQQDHQSPLMICLQTPPPPNEPWNLKKRGTGRSSNIGPQPQTAYDLSAMHPQIT